MIKPIAFYLPQFHPIPENDTWWGKGFTEWRNVAKAKPNFVGHYQPHVPSELGFYDLRLPDVQRQQSALAKQYGVHAFCYYAYWFGGRRVLERPLNQLLENPDIDFPYVVCWANENWTRTWDGKERDVLLAQNHSPEDDAAFLEAMKPHLTDKRYVRVDDRPMLLVYRVDLFPDAKATAARWQAQAKSWGLKGLHLCAVQFYGITDPTVFGFDAAVEFPPHQLIGPQNVPDAPVTATNPQFKGTVLDYTKVAAEALERKAQGTYPWYRGVMVSWDNTARRQDTPHIFLGSDPSEYQAWLTGAARETRARLPEDRQFVFINAWNEWAEGAHLEPDMKYGRAWLEATQTAISTETELERLLKLARQGDTKAIEEVAEMLEARDRSIAAMRSTLRQRNAELADKSRSLDSMRREPATWLKEALREQVVKRPKAEATLRTALHQVRLLRQRLKGS